MPSDVPALIKFEGLLAIRESVEISGGKRPGAHVAGKLPSEGCSSFIGVSSAAFKETVSGGGSKAASKNSGIVDAATALEYDLKLEMKGDLSNAGQCFKVAAHRGCMDGQHRYRVALLNGSYGCVKNETDAVQRIRKAGEQGHSGAHYALASATRLAQVLVWTRK